MQRSSVSVICYFSVRAKFMARHSLPRVIQQFIDVPFNNQIYIEFTSDSNPERNEERETREEREREKIEDM
jgi:hypothetical protein